MDPRRKGREHTERAFEFAHSRVKSQYPWFSVVGAGGSYRESWFDFVVIMICLLVDSLIGAVSSFVSHSRAMMTELKMSMNLAEKNFDALLFDCDGVIAETERDAHRVTFNQAFRERNR